jgi:hypothetical protein
MLPYILECLISFVNYFFNFLSLVSLYLYSIPLYPVKSEGGLLQTTFVLDRMAASLLYTIFVLNF